MCGSEIQFDSLHVAQGANLNVLEYCQTTSGDIYVIYYQGIEKFNFVTGRLEPISYPDAPYAMCFYESKATGRLFIGGRKQLLYSDDGGDSWVVNNDSLLPRIDFAHFAEDKDGVLYVATSALAAEHPNGAWGVYKSEDNGITWTLVEAIAAMHEDIIVDNDGTVYVAASTLAGHGGGLYRLKPGESKFERIVKGRWVEQVQFDPYGKLLLTVYGEPMLRADKDLLDWHTPLALLDYERSFYLLKTKHGYLWFTYEEFKDGAVFYCNNELNFSTELFSEDFNGTKRLYRVLESFVDAEGCLWILRKGEGIYRSTEPFESIVDVSSEVPRDSVSVTTVNGQLQVSSKVPFDELILYDISGRELYRTAGAAPTFIPEELRNTCLAWSLEIDGVVHTGTLYID